MTDVKTTSKDVLLTEAQRHEVSSARLELTKALDGMVEAIGNNQTLQNKATQLKNKGRLEASWGAISGSNDRDLATMIKELGGSLETTQKAVQVVLRLQSRKDHVLREFHRVLVDKIQNIQADTHTLDANQQSAVDVLCEFQEQIEDQLRHHEAVERHDIQITTLIAKLDQQQIENEQLFRSIENQNRHFKNTSDHLSKELESIQKSSEEKNRLFSNELSHLSKKQGEIDENLASLNKKTTQNFASLDKMIQYFTQKESDITKRTELIEDHIKNQSSLSNWLKINIISLLSLFIAGFLLIQGHF